MVDYFGISLKKNILPEFIAALVYLVNVFSVYHNVLGNSVTVRIRSLEGCKLLCRNCEGNGKAGILKKHLFGKSRGLPVSVVNNESNGSICVILVHYRSGRAGKLSSYRFSDHGGCTAVSYGYLDRIILVFV